MEQCGKISHDQEQVLSSVTHIHFEEGSEHRVVAVMTWKVHGGFPDK